MLFCKPWVWVYEPLSNPDENIQKWWRFESQSTQKGQSDSQDKIIKDPCSRSRPHYHFHTPPPPLAAALTAPAPPLQPRKPRRGLHRRWPAKHMLRALRNGGQSWDVWGSGSCASSIGVRVPLRQSNMLETHETFKCFCCSGERERERARDKQTDRQTDRQTDKQIDRQIIWINLEERPLQEAATPMNIGYRNSSHLFQVGTGQQHLCRRCSYILVGQRELQFQWLSMTVFTSSMTAFAGRLASHARSVTYVFSVESCKFRWNPLHRFRRFHQETQSTTTENRW